MSGRLRLLLITDALGGVWTYSLELARALQPMGIDTVLAVTGPSPRETQRDQAVGIEFIDTGLPLDWLETNRAELAHAGEVLSSIARVEEADVVQTCSAALLADAQFSHPCVAVQHSCMASWWKAVKGTSLPSDFEWRRELVEAGLNRSAIVVAPSAAFAAETERTYELRQPVLAVHNGRRFASLAPQSQSHFVFTASRLWDEGKNVATLDAAAARLDVAFEAAGPICGPNGATISPRHLRTIGELGVARLSTILAAQPIFASAALYEPFGLSALEAAHAGCALVLSDIPSHREIWDGSAIFVPALDEAEFASAIESLLRDSNKRQQLGQLAQARAQLYTPERMARAMADIYARIATPRMEVVAAELEGSVA